MEHYFNLFDYFLLFPIYHSEQKTLIYENISIKQLSKKYQKYILIIKCTQLITNVLIRN